MHTKLNKTTSKENNIYVVWKKLLQKIKTYMWFLSLYLLADLPFYIGSSSFNACMKGWLNIFPVEILFYVIRKTWIIASKDSHPPHPIIIHLFNHNSKLIFSASNVLIILSNIKENARIIINFIMETSTEINNYDYCQINNAINNFLNYFLSCTLKVETSIYKR